MRFERMIAIVMLLLRREKVTGKELAEMFEVSLRTIYRDIDSINASGIPIATASGAGGGISIMERYKADKGIFTADDITAMLMGLGMISGALKGAETANALAKLKSFIPEHQLQKINARVDQIIVDLSNWMGGDLQSIFDRVKEAVHSNRLMSFVYIGSNGKEKRVLMQPHRLAYKATDWYMQGYAPDKQGFRLYKLRRMKELNLHDETFLTREAPHPFAGFTDEMSGRMFPVKLLIDKSALNRTLDYCTADDITEAEDGKLLVNFNFVDDDYGYGILLSFGAQLVCLEPEFVRSEMQNRLQSMLALYAGVPISPRP